MSEHYKRATDIVAAEIAHPLSAPQNLPIADVLATLAVADAVADLTIAINDLRDTIEHPK